MVHLINEYIKSLPPKNPGLEKGDDSIRLDKGELPYPPSLGVLKAIADSAGTINRYPAILGGSLRNSLAEYCGTKVEQIALGNGSDELIELILKVFMKPGDEVLLPTPTFFVYGFTTQLLGGVSVTVKRTDDFGLDVTAILDKVTPKTKVLFIANPNNPTANLIPRETIIEICDRLDCLVVIDECYYEFCGKTVADLIDKYPNLIVLRSLSKSFGLAGVRLGYAIANETIIDYINRTAQLFPVNKLALVAAKAALADLEYVRGNIYKILQDKVKLTKSLEDLGFFVYPSATNFLFVGTEKLGVNSGELVKFLQQKNILVADFGGKQGLDNYYFRTSVGTPAENEGLLAGLKELIINN